MGAAAGCDTLPAMPSASRAVAFVGAGERAAERFASHTGRRVQPLDDWNELAVRGDVDVIVIATADLSAALLEQVYGPARESAIGIIGDVAHALDARVDALLAVAPATAHGAIVEHYPGLAMGRPTHEGVTVLDRTAAASTVRDHLTQPNDLVAMLSHADGIDAFLAPGLTMCSMTGADRERGPERQPCCVETGHCFRHGQPVAEVVQGGLTIHPWSLRSRIVVWGTCFGIMHPGSEYGVQWSLQQALWSNPDVAAVVTTWGLSMPNTPILRALLDDIYDGMPLGRAVARSNASPASASTGVMFALAGDPATRLIPRRRIAGSTLRTVGPARPTGKRSAASFLELYVDGLARDPDGAMQALAGRVLEALDTAHDTDGRSSLHQGVADLVHARGSIVAHDWTYLATEASVHDGGPCPVCTEPTRHARFALPLSTPAQRHLWTCPRCGVLVDGPDSPAAFLVVEDSTVRRVGAPVDADAVWLRLGCQDERFSQMLPWPDADPARGFRPALSWPPGPSKVSCLLLRDLDLEVVSVLSRREGPVTGIAADPDDRIGCWTCASTGAP